MFARASSRAWFWFGVAFLLFGIHVFTSRFHTQVYDANGYRDLAYILYNKGDFALLNFNSALRGYLFPLLYVPIVAISSWQSVVSEETLVKLIGALVAGSVFGLLPALLSNRLPGFQLSPLRQGLFVLLGLVLWRDYFNYMLTDFPAIAGLGAVFCLLLPGPTIRRSMLAGVLMAAVINMRPVYLMGLPFVAALLIWATARNVLSRTRYMTVVQVLAVFTAGFLLVCLPQWHINRENFGINRFLVIGIDYSDPVMVETGDLYLQKINDGFSVQKYETSIAADYPNPQVQYQDVSGAALLALSYDKRIRSYGEYVRFTLAHPLDILGLNARHLFNGVDVLYPTPYLYKVYTTTNLLAWANYTALFVAAVILVLRLRHLTVTQSLVVLALAIPALISVPLPVECRYLLSLHLLLLGLACFGWPKHWSWSKLAPYRWSLLLGYVVFVTASFTFSGTTQALLKMTPKLLH